MKTYAVDFETYYDEEISITTLGTQAYLKHPKVYPYLVAIYGADVQFCGSPTKAPWNKIRGATWVSHNTYFDQSVFQIGIGRGQFKTRSLPHDWQDTFDLAGYLNFPRSLARFAEVALGYKHDKTIRDNFLKGKHWKDCTKEEQEKVKVYALKDAELCYALWQKYNHLFPSDERELSLINRTAGQEGVRVDLPTVKKAVSYLTNLKWQVEKSLPWVQRGQKPLSKRAIDQTCAEFGIVPPPSLSEKDEEFEEWCEVNKAKAPWMPLVANYRRCNRFLKLCETVKIRTDKKTKIMPFSLKYHGADSTGRFSGEAGYNMQNLAKFVFPSEELVSDEQLAKDDGIRINMRSILLARPKCKFIIADYSQIEPRVLAWLVGDEAMLSNVRTGMSVYEAHARATMSWKGGKLKEEDKKLYALAKARVLGLGYGCGAERFVEVARVMAGLEITDKYSVECVASFRASNPLIVDLWKRLGSNIEQTWQHNKIMGKNETYEIELPSGRTLKYFDLQKRKVEKEPGDDRDRWQLMARRTVGGNHTKVYGGKLCENLVQATAADILKLAILNLTRAGYKVIFHVHDEIIVEVPAKSDCLEDVKKIMCQTPSWMPDLPLAVDIEENAFYKH